MKRAIVLLALAPAALFAAQDPIPSMLRQISAKRIEHTDRTLVSFGTRSTLSSQDDPKRGIGAARDWLFQQFQEIAKTSDGRMTVELQSYEQQPGNRIPTPTKITDVVATLHGTQPESADRIYVVSGHYDSMCTSPIDAQCDAPGADDDGSGTSAVLEAARVMAPHPFHATIVFMAVAGEEQGLYGSTYAAKQAKEKNWNVDAMFTNDIVGNGTDTLRVFAQSEAVAGADSPEAARIRNAIGGENDGPSRQLARYIVETAKKYRPTFHVWMIYRRDRYLRSGDHVPFLEQGYPAVRFTEPHENYHHQHQNVRVEEGIEYGDLPKFMSFPYLANVTRVNVAALASLALAPARPKNVRIVTARLTNDTDLEWEPNGEPDFDHYEVVWRDTTAAMWTNSKAVGREPKYTAPDMSKDNYFFGVHAVGKNGFKSPVSYPTPFRPPRPATAPPS